MRVLRRGHERATYVPSPPGVGFVNYRDTEAIVAGAVPILERPRWPPQRGPFMDLHDELPHLLIKNDTAGHCVRWERPPPFTSVRRRRAQALFALLALPHSNRLMKAGVSRTTVREPPAEDGKVRSFFPFMQGQD